MMLRAAARRSVDSWNRQEARRSIKTIIRAVPLPITNLPVGIDRKLEGALRRKPVVHPVCHLLLAGWNRQEARRSIKTSFIRRAIPLIWLSGLE